MAEYHLGRCTEKRGGRSGRGSSARSSTASPHRFLVLFICAAEKNPANKVAQLLTELITKIRAHVRSLGPANRHTALSLSSPSGGESG